MNLRIKKSTPIVIDSKTNEDKSAHDFVRDLIRKGVVEIQPHFDKDGIKYPYVEDTFKDYNYSMITHTLDSLVKQGVLKEQAATRVLTCPSCNSPEVRSKFTCTRCGSDAVSLTQLLEHRACGYIGACSDFLKNDEMICPRCATKLSKDGTDYKSIGNFYKCENCSNRFDKPEVVHVCLNCEKVATFQEINYIRVPSFRVNDNVLSELTSEFPLLEHISEFLENNNFKVRLHDTVTGLSGTPSHFDLIAEKGEIRIVLDASLEGKKSDILAFMAKKIDVNPTKALLLDLSGRNELNALGEIYGVDVFGVGVIDAKVDQGVPKDFENFVLNLTNNSIDKS